MNEKVALDEAEKLEQDIKKLCKDIKEDSPFYMKYAVYKQIEHLVQQADHCVVKLEEAFQNGQKVILVKVIDITGDCHTFSIGFF